MARWVGLTTTAVAARTCLRLSPMISSVASALRWPLTTGSPSASLYSRLTSCLVIVSDLVCRWRWIMKSSPATMTKARAEISSNRTRIWSLTTCRHSSPQVMAEMKGPIASRIRMVSRIDRNRILNTDFSNSISCFFEKIRFAPLTMEIFSGFGCTA
jgi:hypothetical protein